METATNREGAQAEMRAYARLVEGMRAAQREFFNPRKRKPDTVARAKTLEAQVDRATRDILEPPGLFGRDAG